VSRRANTCRKPFGWLIDPVEKQVYIYHTQAPVVCLDNPPTASGDPVLPGFVLDLGAVWGS
jgi:Uma2 family endonuclease